MVWMSLGFYRLAAVVLAVSVLTSVECKVKKKKKVIFIVAEYRTGSSFTGSILSVPEDTLLIFEPLRQFGMSMVPESQVQSARELLFHMISCRFEEATDNLNFTDYSFAFNYHSHQLDMGKSVRNTKYTSFLAEAGKKASDKCTQSKVIIVKTTRLLLKHLMPLLEDQHFLESFDYHILLMVRDPRAVFNSRIRLQWCINLAWCIEEDDYCSHLRQNHQTYSTAVASIRERVHFVRFESLTEQVMETSRNLYKQLALPFTEKVKQFIEDHTGSSKGEKSMPYSMYRRSRSVSEKWKTQLPSRFTKEIERRCEDMLIQFNYK